MIKEQMSGRAQEKSYLHALQHGGVEHGEEIIKLRKALKIKLEFFFCFGEVI